MNRYLVTAGSTREMIDRVRDWGNIFTGNTGYAIARALSEIGEVDLVTSNLAHFDEVSGDPRITGYHFKSHADLLSLLEALVAQCRYTAILMTAAVADYRPAGSFEVVDRKKLDDGTERWIVRDVHLPKVKSSHGAVAFLGQQTEKIVDKFRRDWGCTETLVKFKLEVDITREKLLEIGEKSRRASEADYLVANTLAMVDGPDAGAYLLSKTGHEWVPRAELARKLTEILKTR